ncbi:MAG TPA: hypothetical protein PKE47_15970 [Verrucomicrobiota bacterium]|nr:hypothetical protein [Verrucomicrobiota bacterium]
MTTYLRRPACSPAAGLVWLALLLTVIRLSGIQFELILPVLVAWLVYQAATLYCGWQLFTKLLPWWSRRRASCST